MTGALWFTADEIAAVQAMLPGVDLTRCDDSGYFAREEWGEWEECTHAHPCRIHRVVQILLRRMVERWIGLHWQECFCGALALGIIGMIRVYLRK